MDSSEKCFIIAELSANHGGSKEIALDTVRAASRTGADALKIQTYLPETMTLDVKKDDFLLTQGTIWDGQYLFDLYKEAHLPWEWHQEIFDLAKEVGLVCFSSPFDKSAVDFLEELNNPIYKIASFEITDIPLIEYVASKGKPMIISCGIADESDIHLALETCRNQGNDQLTLLKCTSAYPAKIEDANLAMIADMKSRFNVKVGLSDHTLGTTVSIMSIAFGARVIEKHFILEKSIGGPDAEFSLDEQEFTKMVLAVREAEQAIGTIDYSLTDSKIKSREFSRSIYVSAEVQSGDIASEDNLKIVRPSSSLAPIKWNEVVGKTFNKDMQVGDRLSMDDLD
ncbi:pseudaminic acid synthase [Crocinitomix catalasitica]|nr:pseudaminic acid synthase [Crocinitomix catalasitica]